MYQVIARKWRPQKFDDVVGQQAVTRTLKNALASGRLAHAFVFAGPRGVGKTTTARILARALSCIKGPTPEPCGECEACLEIAEGRDIDVLEIDAATHTGVDNVREVIIAGLGIMPVRNRYKVFIIDEVHQLSSQSFNALLKSIEEPPAHVIFMMATTELDKIPETVLSRSQVYEFRTISTKAIADQLRKIADAEAIAVNDQSLLLIARDADGSMRDSQSKLDQVIAFTGNTIGPTDVATVLGLVGRDLVLEAVEAVAAEDASAAFTLAARAVETGCDLRLVCREISRVVRDLLVLSVDSSRIADPEIAGQDERERLTTLAARFSREDLLRAFDLLTRAESEIRHAAQPRYHLEMALLRWIYVRKMVPIEELIAGLESGQAPRPASRTPVVPARTPAPVLAVDAPSSRAAAPVRPAVVPPAAPSGGPRGSGPMEAAGKSPAEPAAARAGAAGASLKDAFLADIRKTKVVFYNTVVAQAQKIEVGTDRITFTFSPSQGTLRDAFEQQRALLESIASQAAGRKIVVASLQAAAAAVAPSTAPAASSAGAGPQAPSDAEKKAALRKEALEDQGVRTLLEVFPSEIRDVEEI